MRTKLIKGLKNAIYALQRNIVAYDWSIQESCNCGVVAQSMTGLPTGKLNEIFEKTASAIINNEFGERNDRCGVTWREAVHRTCSITGKTEEEIFTLLIDAGLTTEDIVHLEFMDNPAILAESGIITYEKVAPQSFWDKLFHKNKDYYRKKDNLILYLQAWVRILEKSSSEKSISELSKVELQGQLLRCEHAENYEEAAKLRDLISATV